MIISNLCRYYNDVLIHIDDFHHTGYSKLKVNYIISLTNEGKIDNLIDCLTIDGKNKLYPTKLFPERSQKPAIFSNIIEHRPLYIFGLFPDKEKGEYSVDNEKAKKSHKAFVERNLAFINDIDSPIALAYKKFIESWDTQKEIKNEFLLPIIKEFDKSNFAFCLSGDPTILLNDDDKVKEKWEKCFSEETENICKPLAQCAIYGEELPIAGLHDKIKGVPGGQASGCVLVCFNNPSENSYNKQQSYNSNISQKAMKEYTQALNYLLSNKKHHTFVDSMTICHYAFTRDEDKYIDIFRSFTEDIFLDESMKESESISIDLDSSVKSMAVGNKPDFSVFDNLDENIEYCIFGLVPNSSRIAVKFCYIKTFGEMKKNAIRWHDDYSICAMQSAPPLWRIKKQLLSPKSTKETLPPDVIESLLKSALNGTPIQRKIVEILIRRIKTDSDTDNNRFIRMNNIRIGLLKIYLNRKNNKQEEIIKMGLDKENKNASYLCGRLFAVLEKVQQDSANGALNRTIKDSFFSSACTTPAVVFARLMKLSQNHISKLKEGNAKRYNIIIGEIIEKLKVFPKTLSLDEQANFILGYYQQNKCLYTINDNRTEEN